jgi:hypothetical protein
MSETECHSLRNDLRRWTQAGRTQMIGAATGRIVHGIDAAALQTMLRALTVPADIPVSVATKPVAFRRGADSLVARVREQLGQPRGAEPAGYSKIAAAKGRPAQHAALPQRAVFTFSLSALNPTAPTTTSLPTT